MTLSKEQLIQSALEYQASLRRRVRDGDDEEWTRESRLHIKLTEIALEALTASPVGHVFSGQIESLKKGQSVLVSPHGGNAYDIPLYQLAFREDFK